MLKTKLISNIFHYKLHYYIVCPRTERYHRNVIVCCHAPFVRPLLLLRDPSFLFAVKAENICGVFYEYRNIDGRETMTQSGVQFSCSKREAIYGAMFGYIQQTIEP